MIGSATRNATAAPGPPCELSTTIRPTLTTRLTAVTLSRKTSRCCIISTTVETLLSVRQKLTGASQANVSHKRLLEADRARAPRR